MKYILRSVKFLASIIVLYVAALWILERTGASMLPVRDSLGVLLLTWRGRILVAAVVVWAAVYPRVGFVTRTVAADFEADREQIVNAFIRSGYMQTGEKNGMLTFRAANVFRRLRLLFEDEVTVARSDNGVTLTGIRRSVAEAEMRLNTYLQNAKRNEK